MASGEFTSVLSSEEARRILEGAVDYMTPKGVYGEEDPFVGQLRELSSLMHLPNLPRVLYPGSSADISVAEAFGRENVINLDSHKEAMAVMAQHGYKAVASSIDSYEAPPFDVVVVKAAPLLDEEIISRLLKPKGYLVSNTWHQEAAKLIEQGRLTLLGAHSEGALLSDEAALESFRGLIQWKEETGSYSYSGDFFVYQNNF